MSLGRFDKRSAALLLAGAAFAATSFSTNEAAASGPVSVTAKGIVGGALLGGEVVTLTMGAAGVSRGWPYFVFGALAAGGGGVGGYFVEKATAGTAAADGTVTGRTAEPALYMLAGGMALLIPALVVSLNATAYKPPETDRADAPEPAKGAATGGKKAPARLEYAGVHIPTSILDVHKGKIALGVPALEVKPLYSQQEMWRYGVSQGAEVRLPVFQSTF